MPTSKKRINICLSEDTEKILSLIAKRDKVPVATKAAELLEMAIEIDEDEVWEKIVAERDTPDAKFISHEKDVRFPIKNPVNRSKCSEVNRPSVIHLRKQVALVSLTL